MSSTKLGLESLRIFLFIYCQFKTLFQEFLNQRAFELIVNNQVLKILLKPYRIQAVDPSSILERPLIEEAAQEPVMSNADKP